MIKKIYPKIFAKKFIPVVFVLLVAALAVSTYYFYARYAELKKNAGQAAQSDIKALVAKVSKLILLPAGEEPTLATITDPEKLKDQPFFSQAKKGDKVLIYTKAKKAILYDPAANKIVEVAPLNLGGPAAPEKPNPGP